MRQHDTGDDRQHALERGFRRAREISADGVEDGEDDCAGNGVLSPVPGVIGCMMAVEAMKGMAGLETQTGKLNLYDAIASEWRSLTIKKSKNCEGCNEAA